MPTPEGELTRLGAALRHLVQASYRMHPDAVTASVAEAAEHLGGRDVLILLADLDQVALRALTPVGPDPGPLVIDATEAGRAFREEVPVTEPEGGGRRVWVPVLDSAERLGVLGAVDDGEVSVEAWQDVAGFVGELLVSKQQYGDTVVRTQRSRPMSLAAEMRWGLLPPLTFSCDDVAVSGIVHPSHGIAGDAFDYAVTGREARVGVFDAMGHGLEASRMANVAVGAYRNARRHGASMADSLLVMDEVIAAEFGDAKFVTAQVATIDLDEGVVRIANAGHPHPVVLRDGGEPEVVPCDPRRPAGLGFTPGEEAVVELGANDALLLYTDGVSEARNGEGNEFGTHHLAQLITSLREKIGRQPEVLRQAVRMVLDHVDGEPRDDATIVLVTYRPPSYRSPT